MLETLVPLLSSLFSTSILLTRALYLGLLSTQQLPPMLCNDSDISSAKKAIRRTGDEPSVLRILTAAVCLHLSERLDSAFLIAYAVKAARYLSSNCLPVEVNGFGESILAAPVNLWHLPYSAFVLESGEVSWQSGPVCGSQLQWRNSPDSALLVGVHCTAIFWTRHKVTPLASERLRTLQNNDQSNWTI